MFFEFWHCSPESYSFADPCPMQNQSRIDTIVASAAQPPKRPKVYCDKWVHEGVCAFTQQGCKYKHEMPMDRATQHQLGLFHGLPAWWKKHQAELARQRNQASSKEGVRSEDQAAVADRPASVNKQNWPFGQSPGISGSGDSNSTDMLASLLMDSSTISQPQPGTRSARDLHNAATAAANRGPGGNGGGTQTVFTAAGGSRGQQQHNSSRTPSGLQQSRHNTLDSPTASSSNGGGGSNNSSSSGVRNGGGKHKVVLQES